MQNKHYATTCHQQTHATFYLSKIKIKVDILLTCTTKIIYDVFHFTLNNKNEITQFTKFTYYYYC